MSRPGSRRASALRIIGVDPGTRRLGYGVVDLVSGSPHDIRYVECGVIAVPAGRDIASRLHAGATALAEVLADFQPQVLALELAFAGKNAASALKLGLSRGAVMLLAAQHGLPVSEYAPAKIKRVVVGHGRATKQDVQRRVRLLCRLRRDPNSDAADALAIALCHAHHLPAGPRARASTLREAAR